MSLLINSTTLGNIIITLGSVFLLYYLIRKFAWDQITGIFAAREKKIATDIDSAENARQEEKAWHKNVKMSWQVLALRQLKLLMEPRKLVKLKNQKSLQKHMMKLNA